MPRTGPPDQALVDAAWNAVAVASIAHREALDTGDRDAVDREQAALVHILDRARAHGLTSVDLCAASGLDEPYITALLEQPTLWSAS